MASLGTLLEASRDLTRKGGAQWILCGRVLRTGERWGLRRRDLTGSGGLACGRTPSTTRAARPSQQFNRRGEIALPCDRCLEDASAPRRRSIDNVRQPRKLWLRSTDICPIRVRGSGNPAAEPRLMQAIRQPPPLQAAHPAMPAGPLATIRVHARQPGPGPRGHGRGEDQRLVVCTWAACRSCIGSSGAVTACGQPVCRPADVERH
jgi:hypothetical protein